MKFSLTAATQLVIGGMLMLRPVLAAAQSVSPPIAEHQERAKSSFQLQNPSLFPITVVLEVRGFTISEDGEVIDVPLDTTRIHVRLSDMSFRLPPRGTRTVFYEAVSDSLPTWFTILSAMSGAKTESGLNVRILLPHVVYLNQKTPLRKIDVAITAFQLDREKKKARVQLENQSANLGRVYQMTVGDGHTTSQPGGGFPLLPHHRRWAEVDWDSPTSPSRITLRFARFSIDTVLVPASTALATDSVTSSSRP
jgi:hypothetical protein